MAPPRALSLIEPPEHNRVKGDFEIIGEAFDENPIVKTSIKSYKEFIKSRFRAAALKYINEIKQTQSKVKKNCW